MRGLALAAGLPEDRLPVVAVSDPFTPALYNDPQLTRRVRGVLEEWLGEDRVVGVKPVTGGEDFSEYGRTAEKVPLSIFWLGSVDPERVRESKRTGKTLPSLHSSRYHPLPEPTIKTGVTALSAAVMELAGRK